MIELVNLYGRYKKVRNASWQAIIDNNVTSLPVDIVKIAGDNDITLLKNSVVNKLFDGESGISVYDGSEWFIVYDDTLPIAGKRYVVAHELGHIFLGHPLIAGFHRRANGVKLPPTENDANSFATRLLSPACVLWGLDIKSAADIARVCDVPDDIAETRAARMAELYKRGKFLTSPLERQLYEQFKTYIEEKRK